MAIIKLHPNKKHKVPKAVLVVVLVVVVAAIAGFGLRWLQQKQQDDKKAEQAAISKKVDDIQLKALTGSYDEAQQDIDNALENSSISIDEKYLLLMQRATNYENKKEFDACIDGFKAALEVKAETPAAEGVGRCAEAKGDKQTAVTYYTKGIELIPKDSPVYEAEKKGLEGLIKYIDERMAGAL